MKEIPATEAARKFSDVLDAVEHRGEEFAIRRRGKIVARIVPPPKESTLADLADILKRFPVDAGFYDDIVDARKAIREPVDPWDG